MADKVDNTLRQRTEHLGPVNRVSFLPGEANAADQIFEGNQKPAGNTIIYGAGNRHTTFKPVTHSTTPGLNNQLPPVAPIVPRGTK